MLLNATDYLTPLEMINILGWDRARIGSVMSRLRDLRLAKFGGYDIKRLKINKVFAYKLFVDYKQSTIPFEEILNGEVSQ